MLTTSQLIARFDELEAQVPAIAATKKTITGTMQNRQDIEGRDLLGWSVKAENLIGTACGKDSAHFEAFTKYKTTNSYGTYFNTLFNLLSILQDAKSDFQGGYIVSIRSIVSAEVFGSELDQARELYAGGYITASAVIAGTVLETTLRQMCDKASISQGKIDKMNADLTKAGVYNALVQKRVTALAGIRNSAAHGKPNEFKAEDVAEMIDYIERFAADHV